MVLSYFGLNKGIDFGHSKIEYVFHTSWALDIFRSPNILERFCGDFHFRRFLYSLSDVIGKSILYQPLLKLRH